MCKMSKLMTKRCLNLALCLSINVFILDNICIVITQLTKGRKKKFWVFVARISLKTLSFGN